MYQQLQQNATELIFKYLQQYIPRYKYKICTLNDKKFIKICYTAHSESRYLYSIEDFINEKDSNEFHKLVISIFKNYGLTTVFTLKTKYIPQSDNHEIIINDVYVEYLSLPVLNLLIDPIIYIEYYKKNKKLNKFLHMLKQNINFQIIFPNFQLIWWIMVKYQLNIY